MFCAVGDVFGLAVIHLSIGSYCMTRKTIKIPVYTNYRNDKITVFIHFYKTEGRTLLFSKI